MTGTRGPGWHEYSLRERVEGDYPRQAVADYLENLARQLRGGALDLNGQVVGIPEQLRTIIEFRERMGWLQANLLLRWPLGNGAGVQPLPPRSRRRQEFRDLKNHLAEGFRELLEMAQMWLLPPESLVMRFMELSREFVLLADPDWETEINPYLTLVENLFYAVKNRQVEVFCQEVHRITMLVRSCHQEKR